MLALKGADLAGHPLPALELLDHTVRIEPDYSPTAVHADVVLVDARTDPLDARVTCADLRARDSRIALIAVVTQSGLAVVDADWGIDDIVLTSAGPAELHARLRLAGERPAAGLPGSGTAGGPVVAGPIRLDPQSFSATLDGRPLGLTFREFELLRYLAQHPDQVFSRERLLHEVWGFDFLGGCRTVDMHVRRLRAKLGAGNEWMIATIRQVGYKLVLARATPGGPAVEGSAIEGSAIYKDSTCGLYRSELSMSHGYSDDHLQP